MDGLIKNTYNSVVTIRDSETNEEFDVEDIDFDDASIYGVVKSLDFLGNIADRVLPNNQYVVSTEYDIKFLSLIRNISNLGVLTMQDMFRDYNILDVRNINVEVGSHNQNAVKLTEYMYPADEYYSIFVNADAFGRNSFNSILNVYAKSCKKFPFLLDSNKFNLICRNMNLNNILLQYEFDDSVKLFVTKYNIIGDVS